MSEQIIGALLFSLCLVLVSCAWGLAAWLYLTKKEREYQERLRESLKAIFTCPDEATPSPFAELADQVCIIMAARLAQQVKTMLAGKASGLSKEATAEAEAEVVGGGPSWLPIVAAILPKKIKAQMLRNPQFIQGIMNLGGNGHAQPVGTTSGSVRDRLQRKE